MSHELRTPLNAILGYTELILDSIYGEPSEKMGAVLERLQANGRHLLGLINDLLDLSKIEAGQLTLSLDDYSLSDVVHGVVSAVEPLAAEKRLGFKAEVAPDLPTGRGDGRRLSQVLLNLVGNAIKFTDKGEVAIRASVTNGAFTVAVCDTGPGIPIADQAKIFEEFRTPPSMQLPPAQARPISIELLLNRPARPGQPVTWEADSLYQSEQKLPKSHHRRVLDTKLIFDGKARDRPRHRMGVSRRPVGHKARLTFADLATFRARDTTRLWEHKCRVWYIGREGRFSSAPPGRAVPVRGCSLPAGAVRFRIA